MTAETFLLALTSGPPLPWLTRPQLLWAVRKGFAWWQGGAFRCRAGAYVWDLGRGLYVQS